MIIIFSSENDLSTLEVAKRLKHMGLEVYIINPEENVFKFSHINSNGIYFYHKIEKKIINLLRATACWWRRTGLGYKNFFDNTSSYNLLDEQDVNLKEILTGNQSIINTELSVLKDYIFNKIFETCPINLGHPELFGLNRLTTLDLAQKHGFKTPYFEVIANTKHLKNSKLDNNFVTKAIDNGIYHLIDGKSYYSYTELQQKSDFINKEFPIFPSLVMNLIDKKFEIRTFYIEGHFYSMAIFSQTNKQTEVDFRKYSESKPNRNEPFKLPVEIEEKLDNLFREIGLNTGSVDFIVDKNDDYVFLEINPVGQYGMTSEPCNYNLDDIIAKYLIYGTIS